MENIPETPDEEIAGGAAKFYGQWLKLAGKGLLGVIGDCGTVFALMLAYEVWRKAEWVNDPRLLATVNAWGGWIIPILLLGGISITRLILAPCWIWKKQNKRAQELQDKLSKYDETPVFPIIQMSANSEPIRVNIRNKGRDEEPIESICLYLCNDEKNEPFRLLKPDSSGKTLPLTMKGKTNLLVTFDICGAHCIQWGVKSLFAVVYLQDGRDREGDHYTIRNSAPLDGLLAALIEHDPDRTWEQSMVRHKRIHKVVNAYRAAYSLPTRAIAVNGLRDLNDAQIRELEDASEVSELLAIFSANNVPHPFEHGEDPDSILRFYKTKPTRVSIGGIMEWNAAYNAWFEPATPLSPTPNTEASPHSPTS